MFVNITVPCLSFSVHNISTCYHTGHVVSGVISSDGVRQGECPTGPPNGRVWYHMSVKVRRHMASVFLDGQELVRSLFAHYPTVGQAGVMVLNGLKNIILIRDFSVTKQPSFSSQFVLTWSCLLVCYCNFNAPPTSISHYTPPVFSTVPL